MEEKRKRIHTMDTLRGIVIIGVVLYHLFYDLYDMTSLNMNWIRSDWANFIRDFGAGVLIFLSGVSSLLSKNNIWRGVKTLICALILSLVTYFVIPDNFIFIGILHFMGTMMLLYGIFGKYINKLPRIPAFVILFLVFLFIFRIPDGYIGIKDVLEIDIPREWRSSTFTYVLGLGGGNLYSADYFPFLPWSLLFLAGTFIGNYVKEGRVPGWMYKDYCKPVTFLGRNTLIIYLLHQPVIYGIMMLIDYLK